MSLWNSFFLGKNYAKLKDMEDKIDRLSDQLKDSNSTSPRHRRVLPLALAELSPDHPLRQKYERGIPLALAELSPDHPLRQKWERGEL